MTPEQMRDASLLELFSLEAEAQTQVLNAGLLALERNPTQADQLEACMRAAHSLKGAARIVGVDAGVSVSHVMEDCLVSAQEGRLYLQPEHIDALLQGTDLLMRIATPGSANVGPADIDAYVGLMNRLLDGGDSHVSVAPPAFDVSQLLLPPEPAVPVVELALEADTAPEPGLRSRRRTDTGERVLRVTAERLNSLLDLSSKSLVETQRLKPYLVTLQRLKRMQNSGLKALDNLRDQLKVLDLSHEAQEALSDARRILAESQHLLSEQTAELDEFGWQAGQRAQSLYDTALACACGHLPMCWSVRSAWSVIWGAPWANRSALKSMARKPRSTVMYWKNSKRRSSICCAMPSITG